jgi:putative transposase
MVRVLVEEGCKVKWACSDLVISRSLWYRSLKPRFGKEINVSPPLPANKLDQEERKAILAVLHSEEYIDLTPREIVPKLADMGTYLASIRTFYRILVENEELHERRLQRSCVKLSAPVLEARGPNEVWTWDITRVKGPWKGKYYYLYVMIDIFSRFVVGWMLAERENSIRAQNFIRETVRMQIKGSPSLTIHNDRGSPMKAAGTRGLMELLGLEHSFSRPRTSNDNPFSESHYKTIKYHHAYPSYFESMEACIEYFDKWFTWYNYEHRHTGINLHTPSSVYHGSVEEVVKHRQEVMDRAFEKYPKRFSKGRPMVKSNPPIVGINLHMKAHDVRIMKVENGVIT